MKTLSFSLIVFLLVVIQPLHSADSFEGEYDMRFKGDGETVDVTFWAKDGHIRMRLGESGKQMGEMILRDGISTMMMIMPQQRMYMEMQIPKDTFDVSQPEEESRQAPFKKTGNKRDILGMQAFEFLYESDGEQMTIWATEELGSMPFANNPMLQGWTQAMRRMTGLKSFFPLEAIGTENGREAYRMTVTRIEKKSLEDSLFLPPQGYMKMTLPAGMGGFMPFGR